MSGRLVHTGQVILDLVMRVPGLPDPGGDVLASDTELLPGGGFNVMSAAARCGAAVVYAGVHGTGQFGDRVRHALHAEGIAIAQPPAPEADTGMCVALVDGRGERTFVTSTGAEGRLTPEHLDAVEVGDRDLVYVSGYSLLHESNRAALLAWLPRVRPARVLFDPGPLIADVPEPGLGTVLSYVDILSCSTTEAHALVDTGGPTRADGIATALADRFGPETAVIVRDGPGGCVLAHDGATRAIPGFAVTPVDTNGAGDAHCGVLAAELLRGSENRCGIGPLAEAARRANAAAALAVLQRGPATAPTRERVDAFLGSRQEPGN